MESVKNTRDLGHKIAYSDLSWRLAPFFRFLLTIGYPPTTMIQDKEKELERLKAEVARLEESNKARLAQFYQLAEAKHQLEVSMERGRKTANIRAEMLKNFETIF